MNKYIIPKESELKDLYAKGYSMNKIANMLGIATGKIYKYFKIYNIPSRNRMNEFTKRNISKSNKGKPSIHKGKKKSDATREKMSIIKSNGIGKKTKHNGYNRIKFPDHPKADKWGWILEHDLIMECYIGRWLKPNEVVHHINGIKDDNRIKNLQLMTRSEHTRLHRLEKNKGEMKY